MTKLIKLLLKLSRLFGKKRSEKQLFDINPKIREQLKDKFGAKNTNEFGDFSAKAKEDREKLKEMFELPKNHTFGSVMPPVDSSQREKLIKKILENKKKNPDQL